MFGASGAHRAPPPTRLGSYSLVRACVSVTQRSTLGGVLVCRSVRQAFDGPDSIVQLPMLACGVSEAMVMAPPPTCDSAVSLCFHGCLAFLHRHLPPQSPPSHVLYPSLHSQQQPSPWDWSTVPKFQPLAAAPCRGPVSLSGMYMAVARIV